LMVALLLRGTPVLYYGDEIGLEQQEIPKEQELDFAGHRDAARTPMRWSAGPGHGFTSDGAEPWLPFGTGPDVESQRDDPDSTLSLCRALLAARREREELRSGAYASMSAPECVWAWRRGDSHAVALNLGADAATVDVSGMILVGTRRDRDGEDVSGLTLGPYEGALVQL